MLAFRARDLASAARVAQTACRSALEILLRMVTRR